MPGHPADSLCLRCVGIKSFADALHRAMGQGMGADRHAAMPDARPAAGADDHIAMVVVGAHLSGMPLNSQLTERGATLIKTTHTAPSYKLYALPNTTPPKPGMLRVATGLGASIAVEVWRMPAEHYGSFVALIPSPLGIGSLTLEDSSHVQGFVCEAEALHDAQDISHLGGWRAYIASLSAK